MPSTFMRRRRERKQKRRKNRGGKNTVLREATVKVEKMRLKALVAAGGTEQRKCSKGAFKAGNR